MNPTETTSITAFIPQNEIRVARGGKEHPVLVVLDGRRTCRRYEIKKQEFVVGRDEGCDLIVHDTNCSRRHVRFFYANIGSADGHPQIILADLDSRNGTYVNGKRISTVQLQNGDKVLLGKTLIGFFLWDDAILRAEDALLKNASTDALTGLYNRGFFQSTLVREFQRAARYRRPLSLVMLDVDHFKKFNDAHGHPAGDKALMEVAGLLSANSRGNDFACRYGGEEMALVLPETNLEGAVIHANRLREMLRTHEILLDADCVHLTASFGVAQFDAEMRQPDDLVKAADAALYRAKQEGRDRVCTHGTLREDSAATVPMTELGG